MIITAASANTSGSPSLCSCTTRKGQQVQTFYTSTKSFNFASSHILDYDIVSACISILCSANSAISFFFFFFLQKENIPIMVGPAVYSLEMFPLSAFSIRIKVNGIFYGGKVCSSLWIIYSLFQISPPQTQHAPKTAPNAISSFSGSFFSKIMKLDTNFHEI